MRIKLFFSTLLFSAMLGSMNVAAQNLRLENDLLVAEFNYANGALVSFTNKQTGWNVVKRQELGQSFQMLIPLPGRRLNNAYGVKQKKSSVKQEGNVITFTWNGITSDHLATSLPITFEGKITLTDQGLVYSGTIENRSQYEVEYICWPYFGEVSIPDKDDNLVWQTHIYGQDSQSGIYPHFWNHKGYWGVDYPTQMVKLSEHGFVLVRNSKEGFSVINDDYTCSQMVQCIFEAVPGVNSDVTFPDESSTNGIPVRIEFKTNHVIYNRPGETTRLTSIMLKPYQGTWHKGVDIYKEWRQTWFQRPQSPEWLKEVHSWCQVQINGSEDNLNFRYTDLVAYAKECKQYGLSAIQLTGWNNGGQDRYNPTHNTDPRLGTWQELKDAIAECEKMGVHIVLFNKYTWADISTKWYRKELKRHAALDPYGDPYLHGGYQYYTYTQLDGVNTRRFAVMCHLDKNWRKVAEKEFTKNLALGASGMLYDENQHHGGAFMCFNPNHEHRVPSYIYSGDNVLAQGFTDIYKKKNPDFVMFGEGSYDFQMLQYHGSYFRSGVNAIPMHRYIDSELALMIAITGFDKFNVINSCLKNKYIMSYEPRNFKGWMHEVPKIMEYGQKVDALRKKYKDFLWDGEYRDTQGATATGESIIHSVFKRKTDGKRAVVVLNTGDNDQVAKVALEGGGTLKYVTPDQTDPMDFDGTIEMGPQSVIVLFEQ